MRLSAYETYMARVSDPPIFVTQLVGSNTSFATQQIADQLRGLIVSRFSEALAEAPVSILALAAQYTELAARRAVLMQPDLARLGLELTRLVASLRSAPSIPAVRTPRRRRIHRLRFRSREPSISRSMVSSTGRTAPSNWRRRRLTVCSRAIRSSGPMEWRTGWLRSVCQTSRCGSQRSNASSSSKVNRSAGFSDL